MNPIKHATSNFIAGYAQLVKIEAAKKRLEDGGHSILDVIDDVGYSDVTALRSAFKETTGMTPAAYRTKYNREARPS